MKTREVTIQTEYVNCGSKNCHLCPHGPYYYMYIRYGSAISSLYIGKKLKLSILMLISGKWKKFKGGK